MSCVRFSVKKPITLADGLLKHEHEPALLLRREPANRAAYPPRAPFVSNAREYLEHFGEGIGHTDIDTRAGANRP